MPFTFSIRFYEELNDFLPRPKRKKSFQHKSFGSPTIKDIIESIGVPHTEVDLILANSQPVGFSYKPAEGDAISVYPVFESLDISPINKLRPEPLRETRFVADVHLGRTARYLRLLGFDTLYANDLDDDEIINISVLQKRIILTRDLQLLKNGQVTHGYYIRSGQPAEQVVEVIRRFDLAGKTTPFSRCTECNGQIITSSQEDIAHLLLPRTSEEFHEFSRCASCGKIYWRGSHYEQMKLWVEKVLEPFRS
jgi:uncharacterized protein